MSTPTTTSASLANDAASTTRRGPPTRTSDRPLPIPAAATSTAVTTSASAARLRSGPGRPAGASVCSTRDGLIDPRRIGTPVILWIAHRLARPTSRPRRASTARASSRAAYARHACSSSVLTAVIGDSDALQVRVLEAARILEPVAEHPVASDVREPDERHGARGGAVGEDARRSERDRQRRRVQRVVGGRPDPCAQRVAGEGEVGDEDQHGEHDPAVPRVEVERHGGDEEGRSLEAEEEARAIQQHGDWFALSSVGSCSARMSGDGTLRGEEEEERRECARYAPRRSRTESAEPLAMFLEKCSTEVREGSAWIDSWLLELGRLRATG